MGEGLGALRRWAPPRHQPNGRSLSRRPRPSVPHGARQEPRAIMVAQVGLTSGRTPPALAPSCRAPTSYDRNTSCRVSQPGWPPCTPCCGTRCRSAAPRPILPCRERLPSPANGRVCRRPPRRRCGCGLPAHYALVPPRVSGSGADDRVKTMVCSPVTVLKSVCRLKSRRPRTSRMMAPQSGRPRPSNSLLICLPDSLARSPPASCRSAGVMTPLRRTRTKPAPMDRRGSAGPRPTNSLPEPKTASVSSASTWPRRRGREVWPARFLSF